MDKWYKLLKDYDGKEVGDVVQLDEKTAAPLIEAKIIEETKAPDDDDDAEAKKIVDRIKSNLTSVVKAEVAKLLESTTSGLKIEVVSEPIDRHPELGGFSHRSAFVADVKEFAKGKPSEQMQKYIKFVEEKAPQGLNEAVGEDGGVLVVTEMSNEIFKKAFPEGDIMNRVDKRSIRSNSIEYNAFVEDSRANGSRHGGVQGYWLGEAEQFTKSKPKWQRIAFRLEKLGVFVYVTDELLEDGPASLEQELTETAAREIRFLVNDAIINGDGIKKPKGLLNETCKIAITRDTASTVKAEDILAMWERLPAWLRADAIWSINQDVESAMHQMFLGDGTLSTWPVYMPPGGLSDAPYGRLMGRPVVPNEFCATKGTEGDVILWVPSQYRTVSKGDAIQSAVSMHLRFDYAEQVFRFVFRIDGHSMWAKAVTPYKGTNTLSPVITIAA